MKLEIWSMTKSSVFNLSECPYNKYGMKCASTCSCNFTNTVRCDNVDGSCTCKQGWKGGNCNEDIKECTITPDICGPNAKCHELQGSYKCTCNPGYMMDENSVCKGKFVIISL